MAKTAKTRPTTTTAHKRARKRPTTTPRPATKGPATLTAKGAEALRRSARAQWRAAKKAGYKTLAEYRKATATATT